jgi:hypothetical protein
MSDSLTTTPARDHVAYPLLGGFTYKWYTEQKRGQNDLIDRRQVIG